MNKKLIHIGGVVGILAIVFSLCSAVPKYESASSKSAPHAGGEWKRAFKENNDTYAAPTSDRVERLGYSSGGYGSSVNGYPHSSSVGPYGPMKIDLGGVLLGAIIGIGAVLIVPKFVNALHGGGYSGGGGGGGYGGYGSNYRSADGGDPIGISDMLSKIDEILGKNNIDSSVCVQRAVCTYVRQSTLHHSTGTADQTDQIIGVLSGNSLVEYMLDGTAMKQALENGKNLNAESCDKLYTGCPLDKQQSLAVLSKLLPSAGQ